VSAVNRQLILFKPAAPFCNFAQHWASLRIPPGRNEALIKEANKLLAESWDDRMCADGTPIDPSPTVDQAIRPGGRKEFVVDASLIAADANKQRSIPGSEWIKERDPETASRAVKEYMATLTTRLLALPPTQPFRAVGMPISATKSARTGPTACVASTG
jgi:hypothetical protein